MAETAERFVEAHGLSSFTGAKGTSKHFRNYNRDKASGKLDESGKDSHVKNSADSKNKSYGKSDRYCYICKDANHLANRCPNRKKVSVKSVHLHRLSL